MVGTGRQVPEQIFVFTSCFAWFALQLTCNIGIIVPFAVGIAENGIWISLLLLLTGCRSNDNLFGLDQDVY